MSFTLDDIRAAAEKKYADTSLEINGEEVVLLNALRLPKEKRKSLFSLNEDLKEDGEEELDQEEYLRSLIRLVAKTKEQARILLDEIGDDQAAMLTVFDMYSNGTELGEASASES